MHSAAKRLLQSSMANVKRALVVEDEPVIGEVCLRVLWDKGFQVDIATNGELTKEMLSNKGVHRDI